MSEYLQNHIIIISRHPVRLGILGVIRHMFSLSETYVDVMYNNVVLTIDCMSVCSHIFMTSTLENPLDDLTCFVVT